jgi:hypothetical protein
LLVGAGADVLRKSPVFLPKIRSSAMLHPTLERLNPTLFFIVQSAINGFVEAPRLKVGLNAGINGLRAVLVKPQVQFIQLLRRECLYTTFNLLERV